MPFDKFLDFYIDGDYRALVKYPKTVKKWFGLKSVIVDNEILSLVKAGDEILSDFAEHTSGIEDINKVKQAADIQRLQLKIDRIQAIVDSLQVSYNESLVEVLKDVHGIPIKVSRETLQADLTRVVAFAKKWVVEIETIAKTLEARNPNKENVKPDRAAFDGILATIDPALMPHQIDTYRFAVLFKRLKAKNKAEEKHHGRGKNK